MEAAAVSTGAWPARRWVALTLALLLAAAALTGARRLDAALGLRAAPDEYNLAAWETRHVANKWLFLSGALLRDKPSVVEENELIGRLLRLTGEIDALERQTADAARADLRPKLRQRDAIENAVEATIEGRLTAVLKREGLTRFLPGLVWPPVDFELTQAPQALAISYRDRIELKSTALLRADLDLASVERVEAERERQGVSALAFPTGGAGAYPTIIGYAADYRGLVETVAHEWTHTYLAFRPLGFRYYDSYELRAMNETVADLVGQELARAVVAAWPLAEPPAPVAPATSGAPAVDAVAELRRLRGEVDALLAAGQVDAAEALMELRRRALAGQGVYYRKINQAFFAFTNLYAGEAGNAAATNPIGPKIDELRRRSASLRDFVAVVSSLTSVVDLDRALAAPD